MQVNTLEVKLPRVKYTFNLVKCALESATIDNWGWVKLNGKDVEIFTLTRNKC